VRTVGACRSAASPAHRQRSSSSAPASRASRHWRSPWGCGRTSRSSTANLEKLRQIDRLFGNQVKTLASTASTLEREVLVADLVIGAVLVAGARAPKLVSNALVERMKPGSVLVDIAIDQGGCFEDSRPTTHGDPTFQGHSSVFYCVANMPGSVPNTSTIALTNAMLPCARALADKGWRQGHR
jgi:alanine dehydrogenase